MLTYLSNIACKLYYINVLHSKKGQVTRFPKSHIELESVQYYYYIRMLSAK